MFKKAVYFLVLSVLGIVVLGIVMLFSTGAFAQDSHGNPMYFVKRQIMWLGVGGLACMFASLLDYHFWQRTCWIWFGVAFALLVLCFIPPLGQRINGSWRWVNLRVITFQPSEIGKIAAVAVLAWWFAKFEPEAHAFRKGFLMPLGVIAVLLAPIAREVDLGTTALIGGTTFCMMFVAGTALRYIVPIAAFGISGMIFAASFMQERMGRLLAFMHPERYQDAGGYQQLQGLIAFGSGGVDGLGLGMGRQKMSYLPFAHTDFIFPMIGEELGLRFTLGVVFCYLVFVLCGMIIAIHARDRFGMLFGFGIVTIIALQAAVNIGVTTSLLPNKGLPLPFISYGGSNLAFCLLGVGILINIYRQGIAEKPGQARVRLRARTTPRI